MDTFAQQDITVLKALTFDRQSKKSHVPVALSTTSRELHPALTAFHALSIHMQTNLHPLSVFLVVTLLFPITKQQLVFARDKIVLFSLLQDLVVANLDTSYTKL
jgi:hypothetical protein